MFLSLAWRNIWRNKRRTLVILAAIVTGVWCMVFLGALMRGMMVEMVNNGISTLTGHIQIHHKGYHSDPVIENSMTDPDQVLAVLEKSLPPGSLWSSRVRVNAVANNARHNAGVTLVGMDPRAEAKVSFIGKAVTKGEYLKPGDDYGILMGHALLEKFETRLGHKLILMSQDKTKQIASRAFRIKGVFRAEQRSTEKQFVFVTKKAAQDMLKLGNAISEIAVLLPDDSLTKQTAARLRAKLPDTYEVLTWRQLLPIINGYLDMMDSFVLIWNVVVFVAMAFGIVNTTLMAVFERIREFGLLKSLGLKPGNIIRGVIIESFFLLLIGAAIGNALGLLSVWALSFHGIDLSALSQGTEFFGMGRVLIPMLHVKDLLIANLVVFVLGLLVCLYPAIKAARFTPVKALSHT
jgi:ABC-type lipoprotein release transport system permease subunit